MRLADVFAWQKPSRHEPTEAADDTTSDTAPDPVADTGERPEPEAQDVSADTDVNVETDLFEDAAFDVDETVSDETVSTVTEPAAEVERPDTFDAFTDDPATMPVTSVSENHVGSVVPVLDDIDPLDFYGFSIPQEPAPAPTFTTPSDPVTAAETVAPEPVTFDDGTPEFVDDTPVPPSVFDAGGIDGEHLPVADLISEDEPVDDLVIPDPETLTEPSGQVVTDQLPDDLPADFDDQSGLAETTEPASEEPASDDLVDGPIELSADDLFVATVADLDPTSEPDLIEQVELDFIDGPEVVADPDPVAGVEAHPVFSSAADPEPVQEISEVEEPRVPTPEPATPEVSFYVPDLDEVPTFEPDVLPDLPESAVALTEMGEVPASFTPEPVAAEDADVDFGVEDTVGILEPDTGSVAPVDADQWWAAESPVTDDPVVTVPGMGVPSPEPAVTVPSPEPAVAPTGPPASPEPQAPDLDVPIPGVPRFDDVITEDSLEPVPFEIPDDPDVSFLNPYLGDTDAMSLSPADSYVDDVEENPFLVSTDESADQEPEPDEGLDDVLAELPVPVDTGDDAFDLSSFLSEADPGDRAREEELLETSGLASGPAPARARSVWPRRVVKIVGAAVVVGAGFFGIQQLSSASDAEDRARIAEESTKQLTAELQANAAQMEDLQGQLDAAKAKLELVGDPDGFAQDLAAVAEDLSAAVGALRSCTDETRRLTDLTDAATIDSAAVSAQRDRVDDFCTSAFEQASVVQKALESLSSPNS